MDLEKVALAVFDVDPFFTVLTLNKSV